MVALFAFSYYATLEPVYSEVCSSTSQLPLLCSISQVADSNKPFICQILEKVGQWERGQFRLGRERKKMEYFFPSTFLR